TTRPRSPRPWTPFATSAAGSSSAGGSIAMDGSSRLGAWKYRWAAEICSPGWKSENSGWTFHRANCASKRTRREPVGHDHRRGRHRRGPRGHRAASAVSARGEDVCVGARGGGSSYRTYRTYRTHRTYRSYRSYKKALYLPPRRILLIDIRARLPVVQQVLREELPHPLREVRLVIGKAVPFPGQDQHVEPLVCLDQRVRQTDRVRGMDVVVHVPVNEQ